LSKARNKRHILSKSVLLLPSTYIHTQMYDYIFLVYSN